MVRRITKTKTMNLLGETPREEKSRLLREKVKAIVEGKDVDYVRSINRGKKRYLKGTTSSQRKRRKNLIKKYT